ncbi:DNA polymerase III subunit delta [Spiroplasma endosymbiont of Eupeodes luniger]|uniref:DNA polymerase III subunit delta n=1 Tax=Spiroplasma endosymbiont of Eupeodes luniger TaxID=3066300 RepID=UPI0030CBC5CE
MFLIYGSDKFLINKQIQKVINVINKDQQMNILKYSMINTNIDEILQVISMPPLFNNKQIVIIEDCWFLTSSREHQLSSLQFKNLFKYCENPAPFTEIFFVVNSSNIDQRKKIIKVIEKTGKVLVVKELNDSQLKMFVQNYFVKHNTEITNEGLNLLLERLPNSLQIIANELNKLVNYSNSLILEDVDVLVSRYLDSNIFDLANAFIARDILKIWQRYYDFKNSNQDVLAIIGLLANQLRTIRDIKIYQQRNYDFNTICQKMTINPFRLKILWKYLLKIDDQQIHYLLGSLSNLDYNIKRSHVNKNIGFEMFLLQL